MNPAGTGDTGAHCVQQTAHGIEMNRYSCSHYRQEMILVGLRKRLADPSLHQTEKKMLEEQVRRLESEMGLDESG
jgi:RNA polymerase-interacting CarD/CdnL/TRCF family regulator